MVNPVHRTNIVVCAATVNFAKCGDEYGDLKFRIRTPGGIALSDTMSADGFMELPGTDFAALSNFSPANFRSFGREAPNLPTMNGLCYPARAS
jgi:hypothetical protein